MKTTPRLLGHALCHIVGFGVLLGATTGAFAKPAYVPTTVNLRAAPGIKSDVVAKIPSGSLIDADNCTEGWCAVTWKDKSGFAKETALDMSGHVPQQRRTAQTRLRAPQGPDYVDEPEYVAEAPVYYDPPPRVYYYGYRPYYRGWGWRHGW